MDSKKKIQKNQDNRKSNFRTIKKNKLETKVQSKHKTTIFIIPQNQNRISYIIYIIQHQINLKQKHKHLKT